MTTAFLFGRTILGGLLAATCFLAIDSPVAPQTNTAPEITSEGPFSVDEGETAVAALTADDDDTAVGDLVWSITGGADLATFSLTTAGVLTFNAAKDYEQPDDADSDGNYEVAVQVSDGTDTGTAGLVVTVENVIELTAIMGPASVDHPENWLGRVATYSASSEADRDDLA